MLRSLGTPFAQGTGCRGSIPGTSAHAELHALWEGCPFPESHCAPGRPRLLRRVYDGGLHREASDRLHQPFISFCTIYNSENFIFILAPCALSATQAGFQATQRAALRARLPWNSFQSFLLH